MSAETTSQVSAASPAGRPHCGTVHGLNTDQPGVVTPPPPVQVIRSHKRFKTASARLVDGVLQVRIPGWLTTQDADELVSNVVARFDEKWRCGNVPLEPRARELADRFGLPEPASICWSYRQKLRWGSCSTGTGHIRISSRLAQAPPWVLDHVIVHELAHLVVPNHGPDFQDLVSRNPLAERAEGYLQAMNDISASSETESTPGAAAS